MEKPILLFDPECPLCLRFSQALRLVDPSQTIMFQSIYEEEIYVNYPELNKEECEAIIHLIDAEGNIIRGSQVVEFLVETLPAVKKFAWLIDNESSKKAIDAFYNKVNDIRKNIKKNGCAGCGQTRRKDL